MAVPPIFSFEQTPALNGELYRRQVDKYFNKLVATDLLKSNPHVVYQQKIQSLSERIFGTVDPKKEKEELASRVFMEMEYVLENDDITKPEKVKFFSSAKKALNILFEGKRTPIPFNGRGWDPSSKRFVEVRRLDDREDTKDRFNQVLRRMREDLRFYFSTGFYGLENYLGSMKENVAEYEKKDALAQDEVPLSDLEVKSLERDIAVQYATYLSVKDEKLPLPIMKLEKFAKEGELLKRYLLTLTPGESEAFKLTYELENPDAETKKNIIIGLKKVLALSSEKVEPVQLSRLVEELLLEKIIERKEKGDTSPLALQTPLILIRWLKIAETQGDIKKIINSFKDPDVAKQLSDQDLGELIPIIDKCVERGFIEKEEVLFFMQQADREYSINSIALLAKAPDFYYLMTNSVFKDEPLMAPKNIDQILKNYVEKNELPDTQGLTDQERLEYFDFFERFLFRNDIKNIYR